MNISHSQISDNNKNMLLEGLRGFAALGVVLAHYLFAFFPYLAANQVPDNIVPRHILWETIGASPFIAGFFNGRFQVSIFFVLSGYVLMQKIILTNNIELLRISTLKRYPRINNTNISFLPTCLGASISQLDTY